MLPWPRKLPHSLELVESEQVKIPTPSITLRAGSIAKNTTRVGHPITPSVPADLLKIDQIGNAEKWNAGGSSIGAKAVQSAKIDRVLAKAAVYLVHYAA
jgi:hypothetical protein